MSPQFVDFDADGQLDIVAGTFDGSPHVAFGTAKGWKQPEQILDKNGERIVMNQFWNFTTKKWDSTTRCDPVGRGVQNGHLTSAWAADMDGDGDLDLLLGDHQAGQVMLRTNEGKAQKPAFATQNVQVLADGEPLIVPGTVTTLRLVDWNGDGLQDLLLGSMGDAYNDGAGGGVYVHLNTGTAKTPKFGDPTTLIAASPKGAKEPTRPDAGLYMDIGDHDGDADLDLIVGGYSVFTPDAPKLDAQQKARAAELQAKIEALNEESNAFYESLGEAVKDLDEEEAEKKRTQMVQEKRQELEARGKQLTELQAELDPLVPGQKRKSFTWFYENLAKGSAAARDADARK